MLFRTRCKACQRVRLALLYLAVVTLLLFVAFGKARADEWKTDFSKRQVESGEILTGGPARDEIPPLVVKAYLPIEPARDMLREHEPMIALVRNGKARAYPLRILIWHEIVSDTFEGLPIVVTYSPWTNGAAIYDRRVDGQTLEFGHTGNLRNADLLLYDKGTESWWQRFTGEAIVGERVGQRLERLSAQVIGFGDFARAFPYGEVISPRTEHVFAYGDNPYEGYDNLGNDPFGFLGKPDERLPPLERVLAVPHAAGMRLYPVEPLGAQRVLNDRLGDLPVAVFANGRVNSALEDKFIPFSREVPAVAAFDRRLPDGRELRFGIDGKTLIDEETGSEWNMFGLSTDGELEGTQLKQVDLGVAFAFAWLVFEPEATIYPEK